MTSSAVLVHSVCTILSNYGETVTFAELATAGLLQQQFRQNPMCRQVLKEPNEHFDFYAFSSPGQLAVEAAASAASQWAVCTIPLINQGIEVILVANGSICDQYRILHPPNLPVRWPPWTACYEILERMAALMASK